MRKTKDELCFEERRDRGGRRHWAASWELSPEDTLRFTEKQPLFVQALKLRLDGGQEPGEIVELDVVEALDHSMRGGNGFESHAWRSPL